MANRAWKIEAAIKDVEEAMKGENKADIDAKSEVLVAASQKLGEKMYADQQAAQAAAGAAGPQDAPQPSSDSSKPADDNVVDADFTEVKDKK